MTAPGNAISAAQSVDVLRHVVQDAVVTVRVENPEVGICFTNASC